MNTLVIGLGEIGRTLLAILQETYPAWGRDIIEHFEGIQPEIMHICFPYDERFTKSVLAYQEQYKPRYTVVHSTVPVGTCRLLRATHSPFRGKHYEMEKSMRNYVKFVGGIHAYAVGNYLLRAGIPVYICEKSETTELAKLLETTYFGVVVEYAKAAERLCEKHDVPFSEAYTLFLKTLNEGIEKYGFNHPVMPVMVPIKERIGGHCVLPNCDLIEFQFAELIRKLNEQE